MTTLLEHAECSIRNIIREEVLAILDERHRPILERRPSELSDIQPAKRLLKAGVFRDYQATSLRTL
jgi:hypothetical protein